MPPVIKNISYWLLSLIMSLSLQTFPLRNGLLLFLWEEFEIVLINLFKIKYTCDKFVSLIKAKPHKFHTFILSASHFLNSSLTSVNERLKMHKKSIFEIIRRWQKHVFFKISLVLPLLVKYIVEKKEIYFLDMTENTSSSRIIRGLYNRSDIHWCFWKKEYYGLVERFNIYIHSFSISFKNIPLFSLLLCYNIILLSICHHGKFVTRFTNSVISRKNWKKKYSVE